MNNKKYNLNSRITDVNCLKAYVKSESNIAVEIAESTVNYLQNIKDVIIPEMEDCIGAGGEYMDNKLMKWIDMLK